MHHHEIEHSCSGLHVSTFRINISAAAAAAVKRTDSVCQQRCDSALSSVRHVDEYSKAEKQGLKGH